MNYSERASIHAASVTIFTSKPASRKNTAFWMVKADLLLAQSAPTYSPITRKSVYGESGLTVPPPSTTAISQYSSDPNRKVPVNANDFPSSLIAGGGVQTGRGAAPRLLFTAVSHSAIAFSVRVTAGFQALVLSACSGSAISAMRSGARRTVASLELIRSKMHVRNRNRSISDEVSAAASFRTSSRSSSSFALFINATFARSTLDRLAANSCILSLARMERSSIPTFVGTREFGAKVTLRQPVVRAVAAPRGRA